MSQRPALAMKLITDASLAPAVIAERLLGAIDWFEPLRGYCACPGSAQHTTATTPRDCMVMLDGAPTVYCFHSSCLPAVEAANRSLRQSLAKGQITGRMWRPSAADLARQRERERLMKIGRRAKEQAPVVFAGFAAKAHELFQHSPVDVSGDAADHWRLHLRCLFGPGDVLWIGATKDSCLADADERRKDYCRTHFRTVSEWLKSSEAPGQFTCPNVFKAGVHSRSNTNVSARRFLVVESDVLGKDEMKALLTWLAQFMRLRAVVDTAGRSLHGWFETPKESAERELRVILPAMGCDPALFKVSQPCRLPGAKRGDKFQRLLWLADKEPHA